ncbi:hypothetical protein AB3R30_04585 [Leptolyngbyaceae cyanobacterium UHCC 1019]
MMLSLAFSGWRLVKKQNTARLGAVVGEEYGAIVEIYTSEDMQKDFIHPKRQMLRENPVSLPD